MSGALIANRIPGVSCVISLEGSEYHHYAGSKEENADFEGIRNSAEFKKIDISVPYLRLESSPSKGTEKVDSVYNFSKKFSGKYMIFSIDSARHEDFSCLSQIVSESGNCVSNNCYNKSLKLILPFLDEHLKNGKSFSMALDAEINKTIKEISK